LSTQIQALKEAVTAEHRALASHPVFAAIQTLDDLRLFMQWHVFAVWDFMSLLKRLQRDLTCVTLPWTPPANIRAARLINEIVLGEETDIAPGASHLSHYELYLGAMRCIEADTATVERFVEFIARGATVRRALVDIQADDPVIRFVTTTIDTAIQGTIPQVLGSFFYGRENVIPAMFRSLLEQWKVDPASVPDFVFYLERHIELDSEEHGPAAESIIDEIVGNDAGKMLELLNSALTAVRHRRMLWDALLERLKKGAD
jgi:hypothetical protein